MQLWRFWVSQKGTHLPWRHCPRSWHGVPSDMGGERGHSGDVPVHRESCSHVAYCASRQRVPDDMNWQSWNTTNKNVSFTTIKKKKLKANFLIFVLFFYLATGRILVRASNSSGTPQSAILVAARVVVFSSKKSRVAFLVALDTQIAAKTFFWFRKAAAAFGLQNFSYGAQGARTEAFVVDVVARNRIRVHEKRATLWCTRTALGDVRVVLRAPIVAKFVRRHQVGLPRDHPLSVVVAARAQTRVQVQGVPVFEVFYAKISFFSWNLSLRCWWPQIWTWKGGYTLKW